jgi:hypothetical protein
MSPVANTSPPVGAPPAIGIEQLVAEAAANYPDELRDARGIPRDDAATASLKDDPDRMARLAELAEVEDDGRIADVAVRGTNVTFVVLEGDEGVPSTGFFPLESLGSGTKAKRAARRGTRSSASTVDTHHGAVGHGTADPNPQVGGDDPADPAESAEDDDPAEDDEKGGSGDTPPTAERLDAKATVAELQADDTSAERKQEIADVEYALAPSQRRTSVMDELDKQGLSASST